MVETEKRIKTEFLHCTNYWLLAAWFVLRVLDYVFSFVAISLGIGYETNPIGFNLILLIIGFGSILGLLVVNFKFPEERNAMLFIFLGVSTFVIIQTIVTLNNIIGVILFS